jgi:transposase
MTDDLLARSDWLTAAGRTHVAMESTGVHWKPVDNLLEDGFARLLVNARHVKAVPGRKTDARDCERLADPLRHGLLQASFVPDRPRRELRELTRYRATLVRERTAAANRLQKTLEGATIKLAAVATDILGKSGRELLAALVDGRTDAAALAQPARGRLREKLPELERALAGRVEARQRFMLAERLAHVDSLEASIERAGAEVAERVRPVGEAIARLDTIPGIGRHVAEALVAEIGTDMGRFPDAHHPASRAGMCPGNREAPASGKAARPAGAAPGSGRSWSRRPMPRRGRRAPTSRPGTDGWRPAAARAGPPWRSATPPSSSPSTCSNGAPPTATSAPPTSTTRTGGRSSGGRSTGCTTWATGSRSNPSPPTEDPQSFSDQAGRLSAPPRFARESTGRLATSTHFDIVAIHVSRTS